MTRAQRAFARSLAGQPPSGGRRPSGPSGHTLSLAERRAKGLTRVVVWLDSTDTRCLDELREAAGSRAEAVRQAIRDAYEARR